MLNSKNSKIIHEMASYLDNTWKTEKNNDSKELIAAAISDYAHYNNLDLSKDLFRDDYLFIIDDLVKRGVFESKDRNAGLYVMSKSHQHSLSQNLNDNYN